MAMKLNCMTAPDVAHVQGAAGTASGSSRRTPVHHGGGGSARTRSATAARTRSATASASRGKAPATPSSSDEGDGNNDSSDLDPTFHDELEMAGMFDAPPGTQTQGQSSQVCHSAFIILTI